MNVVARRRVAVLISGRGSNLAALITAAGQQNYPAQLALVVASHDQAAGLARAKDAGIPTAVVAPEKGAQRAKAEAALEAVLAKHSIELICLAGYMHILSADFVTHWRDRLINIHPSLLPAFKGLDTHRRALAAGVGIHGCTVHFVRAEVDVGPIIAQSAVPVLPTDTEATLAARVLLAEHALYPRALASVADPAAAAAPDSDGDDRLTVFKTPLTDAP